MTARHPTTFMPMAAGYASLVGHHRHLLDDGVRTRAFLRAIARVVKPGDTVVDLGTGTGILAIAARRAGARAVWAIDVDPIAGVAEAIARDNGVDGIHFIHQHSSKVELPERVDVIVSECFGPLAVGGSMIAALIDLRRRAGRPDVRMIPHAVTLRLAPVEAPKVWAHVAAFAKPRYGVAFTAAHQRATHNVYNTLFAPTELIAPAATVATIEMHGDYAGVSGTASWTARRARRVHGFAGWFEATLGGGVTLTTAPGKPETIWRQLMFPLPEPMRIAKGARIDLQFSATGTDFDWSGTIAGESFKSSTRYSHP